MIRLSTQDDTAEIARLCQAQYERTPWPMDGTFPVAEAFHVCSRRGHIAACCGYRYDGDEIRVMHVWAEDGFGGKRAALELMTDLEALADASGMALVFNTTLENVGLQAAVEEHGCQSTFDGGAVHYRRKARQWAAAT